MAFNINLWKISDNKLTVIGKTKLNYEERLENWIVEDASILGMEIIIIGRQVPTDYHGFIDLLGIDSEGNTVILELKRDKTPREVIAQVLDYASWVKNQGYEELNSICQNFINKNLSNVFNDNFGFTIPEDINTNHSMIIIASELDDSSERIIQYLTENYNININGVFFNFFRFGDEEILGRAWLKDPEEIQKKIVTKKKTPWTGYWFVNVGEGITRNWEDNALYGFVSAGQGKKYSDAIKRLNVGDKIFAYISGMGYVGYGIVKKEAVPIKEYIVDKKSKTLFELPLKQKNVMQNYENLELSEWVVRINWLKTFSRVDAKTYKGIFANPNVVCKLRHPETAKFLEKEFDASSSQSGDSVQK